MLDFFNDLNVYDINSLLTAQQIRIACKSTFKIFIGNFGNGHISPGENRLKHYLQVLLQQIDSIKI